MTAGPSKDSSKVLCDEAAIGFLSSSRSGNKALGAVPQSPLCYELGMNVSFYSCVP